MKQNGIFVIVFLSLLIVSPLINAEGQLIAWGGVPFWQKPFIDTQSIVLNGVPQYEGDSLQCTAGQTIRVDMYVFTPLQGQINSYKHKIFNTIYDRTVDLHNLLTQKGRGYLSAWTYNVQCPNQNGDFTVQNELITYNPSQTISEQTTIRVSGATGGSGGSNPTSCPTEGLCEAAYPTTAWGTCQNGKQSRTVSYCSSTSNYRCATKPEWKDCTSTTTCNGVWSCSAWSSCASGSQTRTCTVTNICNTSKPEETQSCTGTNQSGDVKKAVARTSDEWSLATNNQIINSMCQDTSDCGERSNYSVSCITSGVIEEKNQLAIESKYDEAYASNFCNNNYIRVVNPICWFLNDFKKAANVPDGTCRASQGFDFLSLGEKIASYFGLTGENSGAYGLGILA